jgi:DNA-binding HxlR family transcriptional regulator
MVERVVTSTRALAVEYRISRIGKSLQGLIDALLKWTTVNLPDVERARARFDEHV